MRLLYPALLVLLLTSCGKEARQGTPPAGAETSLKTDVLKAGAKALQTSAPPATLDMYLVGFHPMKDDPGHQMIAHHFCRQVNEDFAQCALYDGNTREANLNGIEYIISEKLFGELPAGEKQFWHPHNYEILSGTLAAPNLPGVAEHQLMRTKMNSYGKTWHVWATDKGMKLPLGPPMLAWSFNRDGELDERLRQKRDRDQGIDSGAKRQERRDLVPLARPQAGVDAMKGKFAGETKSIPGVEAAQ